MSEKNANLWNCLLQNRLIVAGSLTVAVAAIGTAWCIYARAAAYGEAVKPYSGRASGTIIDETVHNSLTITTEWTSSGASTIGGESQQYVEAVYEYSVDGTVYRGSSGYWHELTPDGMATVHYDPKDPGNSVLNRGFHEKGQWAAEQCLHPLGFILLAGLPGFVAFIWGLLQISDAGAFKQWHGTRVGAIPRLVYGSAMLSVVILVFYALVVMGLTSRLSQGGSIGGMELLVVYITSFSGLFLFCLVRSPRSNKV